MHSLIIPAKKTSLSEFPNKIDFRPQACFSRKLSEVQPMFFYCTKKIGYFIPLFLLLYLYLALIKVLWMLYIRYRYCFVEICHS